MAGFFEKIFGGKISGEPSNTETFRRRGEEEGEHLSVQEKMDIERRKKVTKHIPNIIERMEDVSLQSAVGDNRIADRIVSELDKMSKANNDSGLWANKEEILDIVDELNRERLRQKIAKRRAA